MPHRSAVATVLPAAQAVKTVCCVRKGAGCCITAAQAWARCYCSPLQLGTHQVYLHRHLCFVQDIVLIWSEPPPPYCLEAHTEAFSIALRWKAKPI